MQSTVFAQLQNTDFETWELPVSQSVGGNRPVGWQRTNGVEGSENLFFYHAPVTEAQNGDYALRISLWYTYDLDMARQIAPINYRPAALTGFYTYTDNIVYSHFADENVEDQARAIVRLTKLNLSTGLAEEVGTGTTLLAATTTFAEFTCPITYTSDAVPDTIEVVFDCSLMDKTTGGAGFTSPLISGVSSILTIDNLALTNETLSVAQMGKHKAAIYPNPATHEVYITGFEGSASIYDATGKKVRHDQNIVGQIDIAELQSGVYLLRLQDHSGWQTARIIKQ